MNGKVQRLKSPTLLILTTYPLVNPMHGGQIRARNLAEKFKCNGWHVETVAYVDEDTHEPIGANDKLFERKNDLYNSFEGEEILFLNDLQISKHVSSQDVVNEFLKAVPSRLDAIHVEQPWLWPLASAYRKNVNRECTLIYGSANIESGLKVDILKSLGGQKRSVLLKKVYEQIDELEKTASREADIVVGVSQADLDTIKTWVPKGKLILAPNGVAPLTAQENYLEKWREKLRGVRFLLYAASAHPPNFTNFSEIVGGSLGSFPPNTKLAVVGSVSQHIYEQCARGVFSGVNLSRLELLFQVSNEDLAAIKALCHGFFLPIPFGGGTNLKTAEALQSGKFVVGTKEAFRGFESYSSLSGVHIADNPEQLHAAVRNVMRIDGAPLRNEGAVDALSWDHCFEPLLRAVNTAIGEN
ncbi:hypothetical protein [Ensifer canadensis]